MNIKTSAIVLKFFNDTESMQTKKKQVFKKKQEDIILNTILYCSTAGCAETFHEATKLEEYILSGKCSIPEDISFNQVKKFFTYRMKFTL